DDPDQDAEDADHESATQIPRPAWMAQPDLLRVAEIEAPPGEQDRQDQEDLEDAVVDARELEGEAEPLRPHAHPPARDARHHEEERDEPEQAEGAHGESR